MCWKKRVLGADHDLRVNNLVPTGSHTHSLLALEKLETDGTPVVLPSWPARCQSATLRHFNGTMSLVNPGKRIHNDARCRGEWISGWKGDEVQPSIGTAEVALTILALQEHLETLRQTEVERIRRRQVNFCPEH
jgi:hypothetical protein